MGLSKREAQHVVNRLFSIMRDTLCRGEELLISGFGKFSVKQKNSRQGRIQTRTAMTWPARKVLVFKSSGVLSQRLNQGKEKL
jgi:integration host factor subunit alpha